MGNFKSNYYLSSHFPYANLFFIIYLSTFDGGCCCGWWGRVGCYLEGIVAWRVVGSKGSAQLRERMYKKFLQARGPWWKPLLFRKLFFGLRSWHMPVVQGLICLSKLGVQLRLVILNIIHGQEFDFCYTANPRKCTVRRRKSRLQNLDDVQSVHAFKKIHKA